VPRTLYDVEGLFHAQPLLVNSELYGLRASNFDIADH